MLPTYYDHMRALRSRVDGEVLDPGQDGSSLSTPYLAAAQTCNGETAQQTRDDPPAHAPPQARRPAATAAAAAVTHRETQKGKPMTVHILREGQALCGAGDPSQWAYGERWTQEATPMHCTCDACFAALAGNDALPMALVSALRKERADLDRTVQALMTTAERLQCYVERIGKQRDALREMVEEYGEHRSSCVLRREGGRPLCECDCGYLSALIEADCVGTGDVAS